VTRVFPLGKSPTGFLLSLENSPGEWKARRWGGSSFGGPDTSGSLSLDPRPPLKNRRAQSDDGDPPPRMGPTSSALAVGLGYATSKSYGPVWRGPGR